MRIKEGMNVRDLCGEKIVLAEGESNIDFSVLIRLNESAAFVWQSVEGKDFTIEDMVEALLSEYEVDRETALADCKTLVSQWEEANILA